MEFIIYAKLIAVKYGNYTLYVFQNLTDNTFVMCTRLPNWETVHIEVGEVGFLKYQIVKAGEEYFEPGSESVKIYKYSNIYYQNFVHKTDGITSSNIIL